MLFTYEIPAIKYALCSFTCWLPQIAVRTVGNSRIDFSAQKTPKGRMREENLPLLSSSFFSQSLALLLFRLFLCVDESLPLRNYFPAVCIPMHQTCHTNSHVGTLWQGWNIPFCCRSTLYCRLYVWLPWFPKVHFLLIVNLFLKNTHSMWYFWFFVHPRHGLVLSVIDSQTVRKSLSKSFGSRPRKAVCSLRRKL